VHLFTCEYAEGEEQVQQTGGKVAENHAHGAEDAADEDDRSAGETLAQCTRQRGQDQAESRQDRWNPGGHRGRGAGKSLHDLHVQHAV